MNPIKPGAAVSPEICEYANVPGRSSPSADRVEKWFTIFQCVFCCLLLAILFAALGSNSVQPPPVSNRVTALTMAAFYWEQSNALIYGSTACAVLGLLPRLLAGRSLLAWKPIRRFYVVAGILLFVLELAAQGILIGASPIPVRGTPLSGIVEYQFSADLILTAAFATLPAWTVLLLEAFSRGKWGEKRDIHAP